MEGDSTFEKDEFQNDWKEIERTQEILNNLENKMNKFITADDSIDEKGS